MPLILAIEPDKRQSTQLASLVKGLQAELVQRPTAVDALGALQGRVPDLVLTTSLLSPRDDMALAAHLRELGSAAAHVQTVTIPLLGSAGPNRAKGGMLAALRREKPQAPMTDGCAPDVFAEQIRQYLATAQEHQASAAIRATDDGLTPAGPEPAALEPAAFEPAVFEPLALTPECLEAESLVEAPIEEPAEIAEIAETAAIAIEAAAPAVPELEAFVEPAVEPVADIVFEPVAQNDVEPDEFAADEPAGLPLSQLLQLFADAAPVVAEPVVAEAVVAAPIADVPTFEAPTFEEPTFEAPIFEASAAEPITEPEPVVEAAQWQPAEQASEPAEEPTPQPVNDFDELYADPMAAQALDELSRQAPASTDGIPVEAPVPVVEMHAFQSLDSIATELAAGPAHRHENLDDLASLFAANPASSEPALFAAAPVEPVVDFSAPRHGEKDLFASLFADPARARRAEPIEVPGIDPSLFASGPAVPVAAFEPEPSVAIEPEPVMEAEPEPVLAAVPEPVRTFELEPIAAAAPDPIVTELPEPLAFDVAARLEPEQFEEPVVAFEPVISFEPVVFEPVLFETVPDGPIPMAAASDFDEEISVDVDAFAFAAAPAPAEPAEASRFAFTLVDGFGDALSDFDVPASTPAMVSRETSTEPAGAPALDDEALSLIGAAARKVGLDALVIEEFERGLATPRPKKAKKKVHAGATQVPAAATPAPKTAVKRPVQDEWGMFDPEQCGFAALEDEEGTEVRKTTGTRVRVISY